MQIMENLSNSNPQKTTTTVPAEVLNYIRRQGYKVSELVLLGLKAKENNPEMVDRIAKIETEVNYKLAIVNRELETLRHLAVEIRDNVKKS